MITSHGGNTFHFYPYTERAKRASSKSTSSCVSEASATIRRNKRKKFKTSVCDKRDAFKFHTVNFPFLDSTKPANGVYISQLMRIGKVSGQYKDFKNRHHILTTRLLKQGYKYDQLCSYFKRFSNKYIRMSLLSLGCHLKN